MYTDIQIKHRPAAFEAPQGGYYYIMKNPMALLLFELFKYLSHKHIALGGLLLFSLFCMYQFSVTGFIPPFIAAIKKTKNRKISKPY